MDGSPLAGLPGRDYQSGVRTKELFTSKERDTETSLDYFGAGYYNPALGRWLAVDPLAYEYPDISPFVYTGNNPSNFYDPNGMEIRGDSSHLAVAANLINEALKDKNINDASVSVKSKQVKKTGLSGLFAKIGKALGFNVSTTQTVHYLAIEGESWENLSANDPNLSAGENEIATKALGVIKDLIEMSDVMTFILSENISAGGFPKEVSIDYSGGINRYPNVYLSPLGDRKSDPGQPLKGIFMHELMHSRKDSDPYAAMLNRIFGYRSLRSHKMGTSIFPRKWAPIIKKRF